MKNSICFHANKMQMPEVRLKTDDDAGTPILQVVGGGDKQQKGRELPETERKSNVLFVE